MSSLRGTIALLTLVATTDCSDANQQASAQAAVGTVGAIAAVGLHRAVTHDCWARCSPGYLCNEESGLCELGECLPGCAYGTHCVRDARGPHCASDLGNRPITSSVSSAPLPVSSPVPLFDAGVAVDASADATTGAVASPDASGSPP